MSFTYTYQKCYRAPTHFLVNTGFSESLYKTKCFDHTIKAFGFTQTYGEVCVYKKVSGSSIAFLILYVDDILLMGNDIELLDSIKAYLKGVFQRKTSVKLLTY